MSAANVNVVVITGNLTRDPELRHTGGGTAICKLRVAVNSRRKDGASGEWVDKPNYFNVTVWGARGESCANYLAKGRPVAVEGRLDWREWESDAGHREAVDITASTVQFLGGKPESEEGSQAELPLDTSDFDGQAASPVSVAAQASSDEELMALKRPELDQRAVEAGVANPEEYRVKQDVIDAIREASALVAASQGGEDDIPF